MSPEEFARIKESEKAHLLEMKRLRALAGEAERKGRMARTLDGITGSLTAGDDTREAMTRRLMEETARGEARFDLAVDAQNEAAARARADNALAAFTAQSEEEQAKARARDTVAQMRAALGLDLPSAGPATGGTPSASSAPPDATAPKTFGRTVPDDAPPDTPPGKTCGRA